MATSFIDRYNQRQREKMSQELAVQAQQEEAAGVDARQTRAKLEQVQSQLETERAKMGAQLRAQRQSSSAAAAHAAQPAALNAGAMSDEEIAQRHADLQREVDRTASALEMFNTAAGTVDPDRKAAAQKAYDDAVAAQNDFTASLERDYTDRNQYEYINNLGGAQEKEDERFSRLLFASEGDHNDMSRYKYMTDAEQARYNELYAVSPQLAAEYREGLEDELKVRQGYTMGQGEVVDKYVGERAAEYERAVSDAESANNDAMYDPLLSPEQKAAIQKEYDDAVAARDAYYAQLEKDQAEQSAVGFVAKQSAQMGDWTPKYDVFETLDETVQRAGQAAKNSMGAVFDWAGQTATSPSAADYANEFVRESYDNENANFLGTGKSWQELALSTGDVIGAQIPGWAAGLLNPALGYVVQGVTSGASAYRQAKIEGYSDEQANIYGALTGASESALSKLLSGLGGKAGLSEDLLLPKIAMWDNAIARVAATLGVNIASEEIEEALQDYALDPLMRRFIFGEEFEAPNGQEILESVLLTAISSAIMSGGQTAQMGIDPTSYRQQYVQNEVDKAIERVKRQQSRDERLINRVERRRAKAEAAKPQSAADMVLEEAGVQTLSNPAAPQTLQEIQPAAPQTTTESLTQPLFTAETSQQQQVLSILSGEVTNRAAESIVKNPDLRTAFETMTGRTIDGTASQQRAVVKRAAADYANSKLNNAAREVHGAADMVLEEAGVQTPSNPTAPQTLQETQPAAPQTGAESLTQRTNALPDGRLQSSTDNDIVVDERIRKALDMARAGRPMSEIFNETGLVYAGNRIEDGIGGPVIWRANDGSIATSQRYDIEIETGGEAAPPVSANDRRTANEVGRRVSRPEWAQLTERQQAEAKQLIIDAAHRYGGDDAESLISVMGEDRFAETFYSLYKQDPVTAETWTNFVGDTNALSEELDGVFSQSELPEGMGAASADFSSSFDQWQGQTPEGGFHPVNEAAAQQMMEERGRAVSEVPKKDLQGRLTSKTASTLLNAGMTTNDFALTLEQKLTEGEFSRMVYTDAEAETKANEWITARGYEQAKTDWLAAVKEGKTSKDITAQGIALYNNAVNAGDALDALNIATAMIEYSKDLARALQAVNLINKLGPTAELYQLSMSVEMWSEQLKKKLGDRASDLVIKSELAKNFLAAKTDAEKDATRRALLQDIADQMPGSWSEKFQAWRYLAMLGNARTHIRNIFGNAGFVPVRFVKNVMATVIESGVDFISGGKLTESGSRTKAFLNYTSAEDRALVQAAVTDFAQVEDAIQSGGKYDQMTGDIDELRRIYKNGLLEWARKTNSKLLDTEDVLFSKPAYAKALASYLKANNVTAAQFMDEGFSLQTKLKAREYAIKEAQKATYRDVNWLSEALTGAKIKTSNETVNKIGNMLIEGVLPFKKTPANILMRGIEYSPLGIVRDIANLTRRVRTGEVTATEAIDNFCQTLTGTALTAAGYFMASQMLVTGGMGDEKDDEFRIMRGEQGYALIIGDKSYTIDWLAPAALPFFVGVELYQGGTPKEALTRLTQPMLELSMLQSLNDAIDRVSYSENKFWALISAGAISYLSQFIPTIGGQIERTFLEDTRQTFYRNRDSAMDGDLQYLLYQTANKLPFPGAEYNSIDYIDAWGRTESTGSLGERAFENFFSPGYLSEDRSTPVDDELQRLYDAGYVNVLPSRAGTGTKIDGEYLSADEYTEYATARGQTAYDILSDAVGSARWDDMSDADKAAYIDTVYDYADETAKQDVERRYDTPAWVDKAKDSGLDVVDYLYVVASAGGTTKTMERLDAISNLEGFSDKQKIAALGVYGSDTAVANYTAAVEAGISFDEFTGMLQTLGRSDPTQAQVREYVAKKYPDDPEMQKKVYDIFGWKTPY